MEPLQTEAAAFLGLKLKVIAMFVTILLLMCIYKNMRESPTGFTVVGDLPCSGI